MFGTWILRCRKAVFLVLGLRQRQQAHSVKWALVGLGNMSRRYAWILTLDKSSEVVAVCSRSESKAKLFSTRFKVKHCYTSPELCSRNSEIDVVYIATPAFAHYSLVKVFLEAGKNVLCEKPLCLTVAEAKDLRNIARKHKVLLVEALWSRCLPTYRVAQDWINRGFIGDVRFVQADLRKAAPFYLIKKGMKPHDVRGVMDDFGIYVIDFVRAFLPGRVRLMRSSKLVRGAQDVFWTLSLSGDGGSEGWGSVGGLYPSPNGAVMCGERGVIEFRGQFNRSSEVIRWNNNEIEEVLKFNYSFEGYEFLVREVNDCIREGHHESRMIPMEASIENIEMFESLFQDE